MISRLAGAMLLVAFVFFGGCKEEGIPKATMDNGKKVYDKYCLGCHMEDGMGVPGLNPPLVKSRLLLNDTTRPIRIVLRGSDEIRDEPKTGYKNIMAALSNLTDAEIADVLTFTRNSFGNKASLITEEDVRKERARIK